MIYELEGVRPELGDEVFVAESASVIGRVRLGGQSSVWHGSVLRGDVGRIDVGERTNIQDLTVVHVTTDQFDTFVGNDVTVGHRAILHGCRIEHHVLVGMGAIVMDGVVVEPYCIIAAGALVTPGTRIPTGCLALGSPARVVRPLSEEERRDIEWRAAHYIEIARSHVRTSKRL